MSKCFAITAAALSVRADARGRGENSFTVSNTSGRPLRARAQVKAEDSAQQAWLSIVGGAERAFPAEGTQQVAVQITVPPGSQKGNCSFRLEVASVEDPDEEFAEGPVVTFEVPATGPTKKAFPWWIAAVAAAVLVIGGVGAWLFSSSGNSPVAEGLVLWLDAIDAATLTLDANGKSVLKWDDKSGLSNAAISNVTEKRPTLDKFGFGGLPQVEFRDDFLEIRSLDVRPSILDGLTSFAVIRRRGGYDTLWVAQANAFKDARRSHDAGPVKADTEALSTVVFEQSKKTRRRWVNGGGEVTEEATIGEDGPGIGLGQLLYAHHGYAGSYAADYDLAELLIYKRVLADGERNDVDRYLAKKWGLTLATGSN